MNGSEKHYLERLLDPEDRDMIEKEEHFSQVMMMYSCAIREVHPGIVSAFTILKKVNETILLKSQTESEPREAPSPRNFNGKISEIISHPRGPILMAKNAT